MEQGKGRMLRRLAAAYVVIVAVCLGFAASAMSAWLVAAPAAAIQARDACVRPDAGSQVGEAQDLRSHDGVLELDLVIRDQKMPDGTVRYCYLTAEGQPSPTLRLGPGDLLVIHFKNELVDTVDAAPEISRAPANANVPEIAKALGPICTTKPDVDPCARAAMTPVSTNLHFHGLSVPPVCHQDDVLKTSLQPDDPPFEYRVRIPIDAPPGLYWYHPHIHGFSKTQVLGGASGALIIEGIERAAPLLAGLPERVMVIRDQDLINPQAVPSRSEPVMSKSQLDGDGDAMNTGTGFGKPSKDLSVNFVPVPYPDYPSAQLAMRPGERQLWRVLNASAITYLNLALLIRNAPQRLGVVGIDGVPLHFGGSPSAPVQWVDHIGVPPGARVEFIVEGPPLGASAVLVTRTVDTGPAGENDPNRALVAIRADVDAPEPQATLPSSVEALPPPIRPWIGEVQPVRVRKLFFSEQLADPNDPNSPTTFFLTVDGNAPKPFDPNSDLPDIVVRQGDVEDWIVENRSRELHDFHIHQLRFQLREWSGIAVNEPFLRDTVNVPYYHDRMLSYPSVRLRMDFRAPEIVGTFVYHCHVLEHEDGGMMGRIQVVPRITASSTTPH